VPDWACEPPQQPTPDQQTEGNGGELDARALTHASERRRDTTQMPLYAVVALIDSEFCLMDAIIYLHGLILVGY